ncbi:leukocyte receptor cluster member 9 [Penaeus vannamei]|uniref:leukocyte receptor cluster member 9 n=1 Tax=Penaeus vannamei TaxID=6689 RepID=UPI00387F5ADE
MAESVETASLEPDSTTVTESHLGDTAMAPVSEYKDSENSSSDENKCEAMEEKAVCPFYLEGKCRFGDQCFNLHPSDAVTAVSRPKTKKNKRNVKRVPKEETDRFVKKPSMKTAGDVRHRIQWDENLHEEYFTVGYMDRFSGVVEKPFTSFHWEHLALVDDDQLAIPQHRIQYFKYKGTKVWDKNERLDHVFGSAGSGVRIQEKIEEIDEELERRARAFNPDDDEDSDNDDLVLLGGDDALGRGLVADYCAAEKPKVELLRATHFLCIKVKNEAVKSMAAEVQDHVIQQEPVLRSCAMPNEILHVTLAMVRCDSPEAVLEVSKMLRDLRPEIKDLVGMLDSDPQRALKARGLSTFGARVLYVKLDVPAAFTSIIENLHRTLQQIEGVTITNHFDFVPHMTLLKVNRVIARERRSKYLNSILYSDYIDQDFGIISLDNIHFCLIDDIRGPDSFYVTCKKINF